MRRKIVAGNWKMNKNAEESEDLLNEDNTIFYYVSYLSYAASFFCPFYLFTLNKFQQFKI